MDYSTASDPQLMILVRAGNMAAFGALYQRYAGAAHARARHLTRGRVAEADDLVSEGFHSVLKVLLDGGGPRQSFRAYLLTTISRAALTRRNRDARERLVDDLTEHEGQFIAEPNQTLAVEQQLEHRLAARAFQSLPRSSQQLLWYTEILGMPSARAAQLLDISPNAVSARAHRARESLRTAYLNAHLTATAVEPSCAPFVSELGAWVRKALRPRRRSRVREHLQQCRSCRSLADELASLNTTRSCAPSGS